MSYDIGTTISFSKKERPSVANFRVAIGTAYKFILTESGYTAALRIPVAYQTAV